MTPSRVVACRSGTMASRITNSAMRHMSCAPQTDKGTATTASRAGVGGRRLRELTDRPVAAVILNPLFIPIDLVNNLVVGQFERPQQFRVPFAGHKVVLVFRLGQKLNHLAIRVLQIDRD